VGAKIELTSSLPADSALFGETPSRIVVSFSPEKLDQVRQVCGELHFEILGKTGGSDVKIALNGTTIVSSRVGDLEQLWNDSLSNVFER
jgi:phosphoribosylformylglycinamidine synthase subunit PurL